MLTMPKEPSPCQRCHVVRSKEEHIERPATQHQHNCAPPPCSVGSNKSPRPEAADIEKEPQRYTGRHHQEVLMRSSRSCGEYAEATRPPVIQNFTSSCDIVEKTPTYFTSSWSYECQDQNAQSSPPT
ncbi:hypothetical protein GCK72_026182 [Caenorhabditis remanei]|uniref:Uncharacterized protein n=1 Tax=Caenorhabditis remanei TaxID=31234 RepID=A0A6A5G549_CAERE|nr:hypothetical protein GCK72_026182 [Caenorhabditis remanei]KAF1749714.1 hypothetical protein GCK72_026182 [Caenorhabditis remanei]